MDRKCCKCGLSIDGYRFEELEHYGDAQGHKGGQCIILLKTKIADLQRQLAKLEDENFSLKSSCHTFEQQLAEAEKENAKLRDAFNEVDKFNRQYSKENEQQRIQLAESEEIQKQYRDSVLRVVRGDFKQICSYCGWESKEGEWDELQEHIQTCEHHPIPELKAKLAEADCLISKMYNLLFINIPGKTYNGLKEKAQEYLKGE